MRAYSIWHCAGSAGVRLSAGSGKDIHERHSRFYHDEQVSVPKEVVEFLEQDQKRVQAEVRQDKRHLSRSEFETVLSSHVPAGHPVERSVLQALQLENLRNAVAELSKQEQQILSLRYDGELTMEEIGKVFGISKDGGIKATEKASRKVEVLCHLTGPPTFLFFWFTNLRRVS